MKNTWQLQDAKSKFSQLVDNAISDKPQFVTKHGHNAVVVLSFEEYKKMTTPDTDLLSFFRNSPLSEAEFDFTKNKDLPRESMF